MRAKPWAKLPASWIRDGRIRSFVWKVDGSSGTAALMIFYALCQFAYERPLRAGEASAPARPDRILNGLADEIQTSTVGSPEEHTDLQRYPGPVQVASVSGTEQSSIPPWLRQVSEHSTTIVEASSTSSGQLPNRNLVVIPNSSILQIPMPGAPWSVRVPDAGITQMTAEEVPLVHLDATVSRLTYEDMNALTGLSKKLISAGIQILIAREFIWRVDGAGTYGIFGLGEGENWAKLPGLALMSKAQTSFSPFQHFFLRSKHELNALKLYFYYAVTRDRAKPYSEPSFERIFEKTGVSERDIASANSLLISSGLLARTRPVPSDDAKKFESNHYYMTGYNHLFLAKKVVAKG